MADLYTSPPGQIYAGPPLPTPDHIRLLSLQPGSDDAIIECELVATELHSAQAYEALSYTWGDLSNYQVIHITIPGSGESKEFPVTSNCFSALTRLRLKEQPRILWIDALCIDQSNLSERNHQVTLMPKIYSQAADVVIHLGEATENSDLAVNFIVECDSPTSKTSSLSYPKSEPLIQALNSFFRRPWFTRVWIIPEVILSSSGTAYYGKKTLAWSAIKNFDEWNTSTGWLRQLPFVVSMSKQSLTKGDPGSVMLKALLQARHCGATNPRDKVYALLPLLHSFDKQLTLTPKYGDSLAKVYTDCATTLMAECGFEILYAVQGGSRIDNLPSWVPDWSIPPKRKVLGTFERIAMNRFWISKKQVDVPPKPQLISGKSVNLNTEETISVLRVSGYLCGKITKIGSTYLAGQGPFPLNEWKALLADESVMSINRTEETPVHHDAAGPLDYIFYEVIGAAGFAYPRAIKRFIDTEKESKEVGTENVSGSDLFESGRSKVSWERTVREMAHKRNGGKESGDDTLPFRDIPFHQAAKGQPSSYRAYVQFVLQNCHSRRFFITDKGYIGIAPEEAEVGDQVYMCVGAAIPFALRKVQGESHEQGSKHFQLVGECYVEETAWNELKDGSDAPQYIDIA